jgi:hypothetical protein
MPLWKLCFIQKKKHEFEALLWEWLTDEIMMCPICGFTEHADFWEDYGFYLYDKERGELSPGQEEFIIERLTRWRKDHET